VQGRLAAGPIERAAQHLAIDRDHVLQLRGELRHELLKRSAELLRIEIAEQLAEGVMTGQPIGQSEKAAQKRLFAAAN
jgi:hypothetical protein